ncbi:hypothetical protein BBK82_28295 [Lentzea guizhouensis]|uniref:Uncharacterized protein n=1 Tax=Lentzea guizhouensis TaxID=1586287 RepID=A0A1B2HNT2_9PSEU|nr:hypothetical protein [Lentzea guizhouensis]ANZ39374.1 hypothetical protein BBK82_28295 [Lentzea guizhouensis]
MGITVIGITHPGQVGALPDGTNVLVLADDGTYADEFLDTDFGAHQFVVRAFGRGSAFFGVVDKARELGAERILFGGANDSAAAFATGEDPVLVLGVRPPGGPIALNAAFAQWLDRWPRPANAYHGDVDHWLAANALREGLRVELVSWRMDPTVPMRRKLTA